MLFTSRASLVGVAGERDAGAQPGQDERDEQLHRRGQDPGRDRRPPWAQIAAPKFVERPVMIEMVENETA